MATDSTSGFRDRGRPSSSTSELFGGIYARGGVAAQVSDRAWLQAMLDVEAALARACARAALITDESAERIAAACRVDEFDLAELGRAAAQHASPVVGLARELKRRAGDEVHLGATSQDIVDTAMMLVARRALTPLLEDVIAAADATAALAREHRDTPMMGRTLLQQALPTTFGLHAAGWMHGLDAAAAGLRRVCDDVLAVQMGGAVGTRDPSISALVATELELADPGLPWHAVRMRPVELAGALGALAGVLGKIARDVTLLMQTEVGEISEGGAGERGRSSAMLHKRNPVGSVSVLACTQRVPGLVATTLAGMSQELQRAAGAWQAEWGTLTELLRLTGSAAAWGRELLEDLQVDVQRMRANAGEKPALGSAAVLVDRALANR